jgi:hypothetical protein
MLKTAVSPLWYEHLFVYSFCCPCALITHCVFTHIGIIFLRRLLRNVIYLFSKYDSRTTRPHVHLILNDTHQHFIRFTMQNSQLPLQISFYTFLSVRFRFPFPLPFYCFLGLLQLVYGHDFFDAQKDCTAEEDARRRDLTINR